MIRGSPVAVGPKSEHVIHTTLSCAPRGLPILGHTLSLARDPLGFLSHCHQQYGGLVRLSIRGLNTYLVSDPAAVADVFITHHHSLTMDRLSRGLEDALGRSLLVSSGERWWTVRRGIQPILGSERLEAFATASTDAAARLNTEWRLGGVRDFQVDASRVAMAALVAGVMDVRLGDDDAAAVLDALHTAMRYVLGIANTGIRLPLAVPTIGNVRSRRALKRLGRVVDQVRAGASKSGPNLLTALEAIRAAHPDSFSEADLRNEILTMLLVGHETVALALTYAMYLVARHPAVQNEIREEARSVFRDAAVEYPAVEACPVVNAVISEALRLYPPVWAMGREAIAPIDIQGVPVPAGSQLLVSPWVCHRDPARFADADRFMPHRWDDGLESRLPRFSFIPFGGGPRLCVGARFARIEASLVLATLLRSNRVELVGNERLDLVPTVTLRPKGPVRVRITAVR